MGYSCIFSKITQMHFLVSFFSSRPQFTVQLMGWNNLNAVLCANTIPCSGLRAQAFRAQRSALIVLIRDLHACLIHNTSTRRRKISHLALSRLFHARCTLSGNRKNASLEHTTPFNLLAHSLFSSSSNAGTSPSNKDSRCSFSPSPDTSR